MTSYASEERYSVSGTKPCNQYSVFAMNGHDIEEVNSYIHLGLTRKAKFNDNSDLITERIQLARCTAYALMGTGLKKYQRVFLLQTQRLQERFAACSVYILSGLLPIEAEIHKSQLTIFGNIIRQDYVKRDLAIR